MNVSIIIPYKDKATEKYLKYTKKSAKDNFMSFKGSLEVLECSGGTLGENVNKGLKIAKGRYIKVLSSDDMLTPNSIQKLYNGIQGYDWVYSNAINSYPDRDEEYKSHCNGLAGLVKHNTIHGGTTMYRREMLKEVGGYDESLWTGEEYELHLRLLKNNFKHCHVDYFSYIYRIHEGQKSVYGKHSESYLLKRKEEIKRIKKMYE